MKKLSKKIAALILSLMLIISVMPTSVLTAYAVSSASKAATLISYISEGESVKLTKDIRLF